VGVTVLPASTLTALLSLRLGEGELQQVLDRLVGIAKDALDGADEVSITLVRDDKPWTAAYTGRLALDADEMQYERGYGPCIDAGISGTVLHVPDMREESRWPDYAAVVVPRGVLSSLSVPLPLQTELPDDVRRRAGLARGGRGEQRDELPGRRRARGPHAGRHGEPLGHRAGEGHHHGAEPVRRRAGVRGPAPRVPGAQRQAP
jgi:hypothetical protein